MVTLLTLIVVGDVAAKAIEQQTEATNIVNNFFIIIYFLV
jgi:hypothetical protein